jgi:hypothetical protein
MPIPADEMKIHRVVLAAIMRHQGARVLTVSALAGLTSLPESRVRWSIGVLRRAELFERVDRLLWETGTSVLRLKRGLPNDADARAILKESRPRKGSSDGPI